MTILPLVHRELRVRSRARSNYWSRFGVALLGMLICLPPLLLRAKAGGFSFWVAPARIGRPVFAGLIGAAFLLCCLACLLSSDAISRERREGTLGLLLLTRVSHLDVLLGKFASAGLAALFALIAFLPLLMIPVLAGGVTGGEAFRKGLVLADTLFLALAAGLWASAPATEKSRAGLSAVGLVAALLFVPPMMGLVPRPLGIIMRSFSPLTALYRASDLDYRASPSPFWISLAVIQAVAWALLFVASEAMRRLHFSSSTSVLFSSFSGQTWRRQPPAGVSATIWASPSSPRFSSAGSATSVLPTVPALDQPLSPAALNNFTPRARQALVLARLEANRLNHNFVGTEHLLLGLISLGAQGTAVTVLQKLALDLDTVRGEVERLVGKGGAQRMTGSTSFRPRVKKVLALAIKESKARNHTHVGTEHILLGLLRDGDGVAGLILSNHGLRIEEITQQTLKELDTNSPAESPAQAPTGSRIEAPDAPPVIRVPPRVTRHSTATVNSTPPVIPQANVFWGIPPVLRRRVIGHPITYLLQRQRGINGIIWAAALVGFFNGFVSGPTHAWMMTGYFGFAFGAWWMIGLGFSGLTYCLFAWGVSRFFVEARQTGALELLLTTPIGAHDIVSAQWKFLKRLLIGPLVLVISPVFMRAAFVVSFTQLGPGHLSFYYFCSVLLDVVDTFVGLAGLCWVALWMGFRAQSQARAVLWAVAIGKVGPWLLSLVPGFLIGVLFFDRIWLVWLRQVFNIALCVILVFLARRLLLAEVRGATSSPRQLLALFRPAKTREERAGALV